MDGPTHFLVGLFFGFFRSLSLPCHSCFNENPAQDKAPEHHPCPPSLPQATQGESSGDEKIKTSDTKPALPFPLKSDQTASQESQFLYHVVDA